MSSGAIPRSESEWPSSVAEHGAGHDADRRATRPTTIASQRIMRRTCLGVAATARRSATSRSRCRTDRPIVLLTTNIAIRSARPPNVPPIAMTAVARLDSSRCSTSPRAEPVTTWASPCAQAQALRDRVAVGAAVEHDADRVDAARQAGEARGRSAP